MKKIPAVLIFAFALAPLLRAQDPVVEVTLSSAPALLPPLLPVTAAGEASRPPAPEAPAEASAKEEAVSPGAPAAPPVQLAALPAPAAASAALPRKPISLDLREMDVVDVLKTLARQSGVNVVVGKNVSGKVTVFLKDVDFWSALKTILETRDLAYVQDGDMIRVITAQDYERGYGARFDEKTRVRAFPLKHATAKTAKDLLDPFKSKVGSIVANEPANSLLVEDTPDALARMEDVLRGLDVPVETKVFALSYGAVEELLPKLQPLVSRDFGSIQADKRSNSLVVTDNPARVAQVAAVVKAFDVRNKAVLIEAKMVQVLLKDEHEWGINWDRAFRYLSDSGRAFAGRVTANTQLLPLESVAPAGGGAPSAAGITARITSLEGPQVTGAVNMLETFGKTRILSSPRITALNNQEAKILVGTKEAFVTRTVINAGSTTQAPTVTETVNFVDVGVKLFVTPAIGDDGFMTLKIKPEVSSVQSTVKTDSGSVIPIVRVSEAETSLVVKDGVTVVIGGLIEDRKIDDDRGVPVLSRIPVLGLLFKSKRKVVQKTELVIFLTPRLADGAASSPETHDHLPARMWPEDIPKPKRGFFRRLFGGKR